MILEVSDGERVRLTEPWDFKRFKVQVPQSLDNSRLLACLSAIAQPIDETAVWVAEGALRQLGQDSLESGADADKWNQDLTAMINKAAAHGWIQETTGSIRAHIERI